MVAFFSIVMAVLLLGITVYGLHKYQTMGVDYPDRSAALPPLGDDEATSEPRGEGLPPEYAPVPRDLPRAEDNQASVRRLKPKSGTQSVDEAENEAQTAVKNWLDEVAELKTQGDLNLALDRCEREFPLWGAYNQACIILRAMLRQVPAADQDESPLLEKLYQLAAAAELLHDKTDADDSLPLGQMKELDLGRLHDLENPYDQIGYAYLRLIRKSDIKLMQARWGRPQEHQRPRQYHEAVWLEIKQSGQSRSGP